MSRASPSSPTPGSALDASPRLKRGFHHGIFESKKSGKREYYESSYELRRFRALEEDPRVVFWTKAHGIRIPYRIRKRRRIYIPDIVVHYSDGKKVLEEVKGYVFSKREFVMKRAAAKVYCALRGWEYRTIWSKDLEIT